MDLAFVPNPISTALEMLANQINGLPYPADDASVPSSRDAVTDLFNRAIAASKTAWESIQKNTAEAATTLQEAATTLQDKLSASNQQVTDLTTQVTDLTTQVTNLKGQATQVTDLTTQVTNLKGQLSSLSVRALTFSTKYSLPIGVASALAIMIAFCGVQFSDEKNKKTRYFFTGVGIAGFAGMCFALFSTPAAAASLARFAITK